VCFYGSLAKGYFLDGISDIDGKIIVFDESGNTTLLNEIESTLADFLYSDDMFPGERDIGSFNFAFHPRFKSNDTRVDSIFWSGLFIGNAERFSECKTHYYEHSTHENNDSLIRTLARRNLDFAKMFERSEVIFGEEVKLTPNEYAVLQAILMLRFVPRSLTINN
jgi:hypothetical protein